jgi:hypothetical protein
MKLVVRSFVRLAVPTIGLFVIGFMTARLIDAGSVRADSNHVFELRIYHAVPGKLPALEERFRERTSKILARHNLHVVGYWVTEDDKDSSFVFLFAHRTREEAQANWEAFRADPELKELARSEQAEKLIERSEIIWLRPTDFSPMK